MPVESAGGWPGPAWSTGSSPTLQSSSTPWWRERVSCCLHSVALFQEDADSRSTQAFDSWKLTGDSRERPVLC